MSLTLTSVPLPMLNSMSVRSDAIARTLASATSATCTKSNEALPSPVMIGGSPALIRLSTSRTSPASCRGPYTFM